MNKDILPVLDEISAVLKKHQMAGLVIVGNRTHCDWRMELAAPWSCARLGEAGGQPCLRFRSQLEDYPSLAAQREAIEATVGLFVGFSDILDQLTRNMEALLVAISKQVDFIGRTTEEGEAP